MVVGLHGVDFVVGELSPESIVSSNLTSTNLAYIRESLDERVLVGHLSSLLGHLLLGLVELSSVGVLLECNLEGLC